MNASRALQKLHPALHSRTNLVGPFRSSGRFPVAAFQKESKRSVNVFAEFTESIKRQVEENKEFQKNVKLLSDETNRLAESDAMQVAKKTATQTSKIVKNVSKAVEATLETPVVKQTGKVIHKVGEVTVKAGQKVAEPILETEAAKKVASGVKSVQKEILESSSNAFYAEYKPKDIRDQERAEKMEAMKKEQLLRLNHGIPTSSAAGPILPNKDAGESVVLHRSSRIANAWNSFKENSPIAQKLFTVKRGLDESDHPFLERMREWMDRTKINETEEARVIRAIREVDPSFRKDLFLKEMTQYVVPDVLEMVLKEDPKGIADWCSERALAKLTAGFEAAKAQGLIADSKLLDIRRVDIRQLTLLEDELPIIMIGFSTHEILVYKNKKGEVVLGDEDSIQTANYVIAFTKAQILDPEAALNPKTNGWLIVDWHRSAGW